MTASTLARIRQIVRYTNNSTAEEDMWEIRQILEEDHYRIDFPGDLPKLSAKVVSEPSNE